MRTRFVKLNCFDYFYFDFQEMKWVHSKEYEDPKYPTDLERETLLIQEYKLKKGRTWVVFEESSNTIITSTIWAKSVLPAYEDYTLVIEALDCVEQSLPERQVILDFTKGYPRFY